MAKEFVLDRCLGLNNKTNPKRLIAGDGKYELAQAINVNITQDGAIERRKGAYRKLTGSFHSLFTYKNICYLVKDNVLSYMREDFDVKDLVYVGDKKVSYVGVGDRVFFSNDDKNGYIKGLTYYPWEKGEYIGPATTKEFYGPPVGHLLEIYNGFMLVAQGDVVWYSLPFNYSLFYYGGDYIPFSSRIRMLRSVKDGIYVSTEEEILYLKGDNPKEFSLIKMTDYPAVEGTDIVIDGRKLRGGEILEKVIIFCAQEGICIAGPKGVFENLTNRRLVCPKSSEGAGLCIDDRYVCTLRL